MGEERNTIDISKYVYNDLSEIPESSGTFMYSNEMIEIESQVEVGKFMSRKDIRLVVSQILRVEVKEVKSGPINRYLEKSANWETTKVPGSYKRVGR